MTRERAHRIGDPLSRARSSHAKNRNRHARDHGGASASRPTRGLIKPLVHGHTPQHTERCQKRLCPGTTYSQRSSRGLVAGKPTIAIVVSPPASVIIFLAEGSCLSFFSFSFRYGTIVSFSSGGSVMVAFFRKAAKAGAETRSRNSIYTGAGVLANASATATASGPSRVLIPNK